MDGRAPEPLITLKDRSEWRAWLEANHSESTGSWILVRKKGSRGQGVSYDEAVEEALCFGWIDGQMKGVDEVTYALRFSPRKPRSIWSKVNADRVEKLIREGKMTTAGLQRIDEAKKDGKWDTAYSSRDRVAIPIDLELALDKDADAKMHFHEFSNSTRFQYVYWINQAKTEATRLKRISETVRRARDSVKP